MQIETSTKVDLITFDATHQEYALIICTTGSWNDSEQERERLMDKINAYCAFITDGQLLEQFPQAHGKSVRIQLDSLSPIPASLREFIAHGQQLLQEQKIKLCVNFVTT